MAHTYQTTPGKPWPLGATFYGGYTQFNLFSRNATEVTLCFFKKKADAEPEMVFVLDPMIHKTGDIWHIAIHGSLKGKLYGYLVDGPYKPQEGHRFNKHRLLIDPYALALSAGPWQLDQARGFNWKHKKMDLVQDKHDTFAVGPKCVVVDETFEWEGDQFPRVPMQDSIIYEMHVKGFTHHSSSKVNHPGTYKGVAEKIPYLKELGVTAVELLPIQEFDETENFRTNPKTGEKLSNYWGYSSMAFFAPKASCATAQEGQQVQEFKEMVKALHHAGIEVILDVVFNHTAEGSELGPTLSFRGLDNTIYYLLEEGRYYKNFSGCGNAVNCNHPVVRGFILDCLRYWVVEMHVDGFRFDLASILGRGPDGSVLANPPLLERIAEDPLLRDTKIIAEAWDAAGVYQVGSFPGGRWAEWNGKYRDTIRGFWRGDPGRAGEMATRIGGSSDLYEVSGRNPFHSINFITCHDGFTLMDLVSYNRKHNDENGEDNRDGTDMNYSANYGLEGPVTDPEILSLRNRQRANMMVTLFLSQGIPMILAGDEMGRTQMGNNNAWCQDNIISWTDWQCLEKDREFFEGLKKLIAFRKSHPVFRRFHFFSGQKKEGAKLADIHWYGQRGYPAKWHGQDRSLAFFLSGASRDTRQHSEDADFFVLCNANYRDVNFRLPIALRQLDWHLAIDTGGDKALTIYERGEEPFMDTAGQVLLKARSLVVLMSEKRRKEKIQLAVD